LQSVAHTHTLFERDLRFISGQKGVIMTTAAQILKSKPDNNIYTTTPAAFVFDAVKLMAEKRIGALLVVEGDTIVGIVSERDYARKIDIMARSSKDTQVREIMTSPVMYVRPGHSSEECMALMTENRLRHLPVMENGKLVGLVSIGDLVKDVISEQKFIIEQLEHYITGSVVEPHAEKVA
jgi:CBS domain-containing protein